MLPILPLQSIISLGSKIREAKETSSIQMIRYALKCLKKLRPMEALKLKKLLSQSLLIFNWQIILLLVKFDIYFLLRYHTRA
jgi:hypothetical protein